MKISVIVAVYNAAKTLQRCIDSINAQSYLDRELIIIDGGSTDGTVDILRTNNDLIAHWESAPDRGIYHAWNKGVAHATGEWVCFLGADDVFHNETLLATVIPMLRGNVVYGDNRLVDTDGNYAGLISHPWNRNLFNNGRMFPHVGAFHRRLILTGFDESFQIAGDYDFMLRMLKNEDPIYIPLLFCDMHIGGISNNPKYYRIAVNETMRALRKNGYKSCTYYTCNLIIKGDIISIIRSIFGESVLLFVQRIWRFMKTNYLFV